MMKILVCLSVLSFGTVAFGNTHSDTTLVSSRNNKKNVMITYHDNGQMASKTVVVVSGNKRKICSKTIEWNTEGEKQNVYGKKTKIIKTISWSEAVETKWTRMKNGKSHRTKETTRKSGKT